MEVKKIFVAGAGGLGSAAAFYLAAAGVGHLRICDKDVVEPSNLNRQILHSQDRVGCNKAASAKESLEALNPYVKITAIEGCVSEETVTEYTADADLILDCLDNFPTRYLPLCLT